MKDKAPTWLKKVNQNIPIINDAINPDKVLFGEITLNNFGPPNKLPKFKQISFSKIQQQDSDKTYLNVQLLDNSKWDIFNDFVLLLIDSCEKEEKESDALRVFIQRSYRWLALMKGGFKLSLIHI